MTEFTTNPGVNAYETQGPEGLLRVEADKPYSTDDPREIAILEGYGAHAVTKSAAAPARHAEKKIERGDES